MYRESKEKRMSIGISLGIHLIVFILVASTGLFMRMDSSVAKVVDITVYEDIGGQDSGGGDDGGSAEESESAIEDIVVKNDTNVPPVSHQYTEAAEQKRVQENKDIAKKASASPNASSNAGDGTGQSAGHGNGSGTGTGTGNGSGSSDGSGSGSGSGSGNGDGAGDALVPKVKPQLLDNGSPVYPRRLRDQGIEGRVLVKVLVNANGQADSVEVNESSGHDAFDKAAVKAAYRASFSPAKNVYGDAVACYTNLPYGFRITN